MGRFYSQKAVQMFLLYQRKDGYIGKRAVETYRRKKKKNNPAARDPNNKNKAHYVIGKN